MAMPQQQGQSIMPQQQCGDIFMTTLQQQTEQNFITTPQQETGQVVLATSQQHSKLKVQVILGLGIIQMFFGAVTIIFGILPITLVSDYWLNKLSFGIWFGVWITVVGVVGIKSAFRPQNNGLNRVNMGFNIVCTVISVINASFAGIGIAYFSSSTKRDYYHYSSYINKASPKDAGIRLYALLLLLMIGEFVISLIISIYCCKAVCSCCKQFTDGQVVYPGTVIPYNNVAPVMHQSYTTHGQMVNKQHGQMVNKQRVMMGAHTNTAYSAEQQQQPPQYQKSPPQ